VLCAQIGTPSQNHKLTSGDEDVIRKSLFNCWHTELVLRLPTKTPDLIRYANHWSPVQAYYAIYLCLRAYLRSSGDGVADTHATTLRTISSQLEQRNLLLPFWSVVCSGGSGDANLKNVEYRNLPPGITVRMISSLSTPRVEDFWHWLAMMLRTTRSRNLKSKLEDKNTRKKYATKGGKPRQSYNATQRKEVCASIPATSIFDFFYRLRIRSNYEDADAFLLGSLSDADATVFHRALALVTSCTLFNLERLTAYRLGKTKMDDIVEAFLNADRHGRGLETVSARKQFWI